MKLYVSLSDKCEYQIKTSKGKTGYSPKYAWCQQKQIVTDRWTDRQTNDKVIPNVMLCFPLRHKNDIGMKLKTCLKNNNT